jgi:hypothetical protein
MEMMTFQHSHAQLLAHAMQGCAPLALEDDVVRPHSIMLSPRCSLSATCLAGGQIQRLKSLT